MYPNIYDYCYINPSRVDSFYSQVNGSLVKEQKEQSQKGAKGVGKVGVELGNILAKLGLAKATGSAQFEGDYSHVHETISSLSIENKINVIRETFTACGLVSTVSIDDRVTAEELLATIRDSGLHLFFGTFKMIIDDASDDEVRAAVFAAMRSRYYESPQPRPLVHKKATLVSKATAATSAVPIVQVPLFLEHMVPNQAFVAYGHGFMPLTVLGLTLLSSEHFVVNPLAVWFSYA